MHFINFFSLWGETPQNPQKHMDMCTTEFTNQTRDQKPYGNVYKIWNVLLAALWRAILQHPRTKFTKWTNLANVEVDGSGPSTLEMEKLPKYTH